MTHIKTDMFCKLCILIPYNNIFVNASFRKCTLILKLHIVTDKFCRICCIRMNQDFLSLIAAFRHSNHKSLFTMRRNITSNRRQPDRLCTLFNHKISVIFTTIMFHIISVISKSSAGYCTISTMINTRSRTIINISATHRKQTGIYEPIRQSPMNRTTLHLKITVICHISSLPVTVSGIILNFSAIHFCNSISSDI